MEVQRKEKKKVTHVEPEKPSAKDHPRNEDRKPGDVKPVKKESSYDIIKVSVNIF
jgi:hypothetical protein